MLGQVAVRYERREGLVVEKEVVRVEVVLGRRFVAHVLQLGLSRRRGSCNTSVGLEFRRRVLQADVAVQGGAGDLLAERLCLFIEVEVADDEHEVSENGLLLSSLEDELAFVLADHELLGEEFPLRGILKRERASEPRSKTNTADFEKEKNERNMLALVALA